MSAYTSAAKSIRLAIAALRGAGHSPDNGPFGAVVADLERIAGLCTERARADRKPGKRAHTGPTATVQGKGINRPVVTATGATVPSPVNTSSKPEIVAEPKTATEPTVKAAAQGATGSKTKGSGLAAYRQLQAECKAKGLPCKGTADELRARLANAAAAPKTEPATEPAKGKGKSGPAVKAPRLTVAAGEHTERDATVADVAAWLQAEFKASPVEVARALDMLRKNAAAA